MYFLLAFIFFATLFIGLALVAAFIFGPRTWRTMRRRSLRVYLGWLVIYFLFIFFGTGPVGARLYVSPESSPYKLPWEAGVSRFVSQGNRSFTSHRGLHLYAWDFWMPIGTKILAAREGNVQKIEQDFDGIGLNSNYVVIEHSDGTHALYAHIKKGGALVHVGDHVIQGQAIAYSGMVGQTINPHLHFVVLNKEETASLPITFSDVSDEVPLAGRFYKSGNVVY